MAVLYPETLPAPLVKSVQIRRQKTTRTINFDDRNQRRTNHAKNAPFIIECQLVMDTIQLDAFDYWLKFDISYGVSWVDAPWLISLGFSDHYCRFLGIPNINKSGGVWFCDCLLEVQETSKITAVYSESWASSNQSELAFDLPADGLSFWFAADEQVLNTIYNAGDFIPNKVAAGIQLESKIVDLGYGGPDPLDGMPRIKENNNFQGLQVSKQTTSWKRPLMQATQITSGHNPVTKFLITSRPAGSIGELNVFVNKNGLGTFRGIRRADPRVALYTADSVELIKDSSTAYNQIEVLMSECPGRVDQAAPYRLTKNNILYEERSYSVYVYDGYLEIFNTAANWNLNPTLVHELIVYERELTQSEKDDIYAYLAQKWQVE